MSKQEMTTQHTSKRSDDSEGHEADMKKCDKDDTKWTGDISNCPTCQDTGLKYEPWIESGQTELEYFKCKYIEARKALLKVAREARKSAIDEAVEYCKTYREAYDESIFPVKDMKFIDPEVRTTVAGRMGRHVLGVCIKDLKALSRAPDKGGR